MLLDKVRFIPFAARSPYENMAFDEFLLNDFIENGIPYFRLYAWNPSGLSIGVNQSIAAIDTDKCRNENIPVVRRMTGGGAILHDREITYSLVIPAEAAGKNAGVKESFEEVTAFIREMYALFGLEARYAKDVFPEKKHGEHSAFCFSSSEEYDLVINEKKIGGNAQARRKNAIFQHGSIPLGKNRGAGYMFEETDQGGYTSLEEILGREVSTEEASVNALKAFEKTFNVRVEDYPLVLADKKKIVQLMTGKYGKAEWNFSGKI